MNKFSDFFRNATPAEKEKVMQEVMERACERQNRPLKETVGWRPIETAPRDGRQVLIFVNGLVRQARFSTHRRAKTNWIVCWDGHYSASSNPTHWMPLPEAPNAQVQPPAAPGTEE